MAGEMKILSFYFHSTAMSEASKQKQESLEKNFFKTSEATYVENLK